ncbi:MAG: hypothetical protein Q7S79_03730, partial [bacterium]|nr:hypothetical protein [bacterium]
GVRNPENKTREFLTRVKIFPHRKKANVAQKKTIANISNAAGTLKSVDIEKKKPAKKIFFIVKFLVKRRRNPAIVGPIIKISAFAIFPSRSGITVKRVKIPAERTIVFIFLPNNLLARSQKRTIVAACQKRRIKRNQKTDPENAASK